MNRQLQLTEMEQMTNAEHVFSENVQQHNKAVREHQLNSKARANKSWRDLKQKDK